eukprot:1277877-Rhodomonas_salina.1
MEVTSSSLLGMLLCVIFVAPAASFNFLSHIPTTGSSFISSSPPSLPPSARRPTCLDARQLRMQVGWTGGDLEGGRDDERNADIQALKKLFYRTDAGPAPNERVSAAEFGLLRDIPIARFRMMVLPHQQVVFNIFQPQLVHMFESLLATPKPWLYMHVQLPGGVDNLGNLQYALPGLGEDDGGAPGEKADLHGTLMQITAMERMPDSRIALICQ